MLQYRIDPAHLVACAFGIDLCQHRLQLNAPKYRFLVGDILWFLAAGFFQPQAERTFVGGEPHSHGGIGRTNAEFADSEPLLAG